MIEVAAGIVWLDRRRTEPDLSYDAILESLSDAKYDVVEGKDNPPD